jgi:hypothetical protein
VPVWHEATREWREAGELVVVGIAQEQHPERTRLYAQWKEYDWPILWDPFNLTGSKVVPNVVLVDEHGIVRSTRPDPRTFVETFLEAGFDAPDDSRDRIASPPICSYPAAHAGAEDPWSLLTRGGEPGAALEDLEELAFERMDDPALAFRAGVARRMRYDSAATTPGDFQAAIDHWARALALDPNQYIWRRRIQQYGPRMDKPYEFYTWVDEARAAIRARGEEPVELVAELTPAELAQPRKGAVPAAAAVEEPDPEGRITRDESGFVGIESAVAFDTSDAGGAATVHLAFRPSAKLDTHWNHEGGPPLTVWLEAPDGWGLETNLLEVPPSTEHAASEELFRFTVEVALPDGTDEGLVTGHALYFVCEGALGTCRYLRQDLEVEVVRPFGG